MAALLHRFHNYFAQMQPRDRRAAFVGAVVAGLTLLWWTYQGFATAPWRNAPQVWCYDLNTGQFFAAPADAAPPIAAPSGPLPTGELAGVRAWAFACGSCTAPEVARTVWLETHHPASFTDSPPVALERSAYGPVAPAGSLVRRVGDDTWRPVELNVESMLHAMAQVCGEGGTPTLCMP